MPSPRRGEPAHPGPPAQPGWVVGDRARDLDHVASIVAEPPDTPEAVGEDDSLEATLLVDLDVLEVAPPAQSGAEVLARRRHAMG